MKRIAKQHATNAVEQNALNWLNSRAQGYDNGAAGAARDLFYGGCQAGTVGHLVYYADTLKFYRKHRATISQMLRESMEETGIDSPAGLFGDKWDASDPLATEQSNQNLLAWFAFEEAARIVCHRAGIET